MANESRPDIKTQAIEILEEMICNDVIVEYIINHMIDNDVFTEEDYQQIIRCGEQLGSVEDLAVRDRVLYTQTKCFLKILRQKFKTHDYAYNNFLWILLKDGYYPWIGHQLMSVVSDLKKAEETQLSAMPVLQEQNSVVICHDIPNCVKNLLQRNNKLEEIRDNLIKFGIKGKGWLIIYGMAGNGKTILAAEAVRNWYCEHFKDGIWWTNCGQMANKKEKFDESMLLIKMQLLWERISGQENIKFECIENAVHKLKTYFKRHPKSLLILDDVWNKEVIEKFEIGVPVMVTSRDTSVVPYRFENDDKIFIATTDCDNYGLSFEESRKLLSLWVCCHPSDLNDEFVNKIIEKFKGNPMCLTLIGSFMEEKGNDLNAWKSFYNSIDINEQKSPQRRRHSSGNHSLLHDILGFDNLVENSYKALKEELRNKYRYFALFVEDIRIPIEVFQTIWSVDKFQVDSLIMDELVKKSLVMKLKTNDFTLYMVHDIILNYLKKECSSELQKLHAELLDRYFDLCQQSDDSYKYSELPNDGYIYYFLGYHIYKSNRFELFPQIFLDLSFVVKKIRNTGPSDLLNDYINYREHFKDNIDKYRDFVCFVSTNADLLCDLSIDVIQLALCQPKDSFVYKNALDLVSNSGRLYLKWCNESNVKTSKLLSTKLHSGSVKYAVFDVKGNVVVSVGTDKLIKLWDSNTGKQLRTLRGHQNTINCCQISHDGTQLITASDDGMVKVWDISYYDINGNNKEPDVFSPRPRSGSEYPHFESPFLYDDSSYTYREHVQELTSDETSPETPPLAVEVKCCAITWDKQNLVASGGTDLYVHIWRLSDMKTLFVLNGHKHTVSSCQFSSDSDKLVSASGDVVIVWNTKDGSVIKTLNHEMNVQNCVFGPKLTLIDYIFTSSGRYVYQWSATQTNQSNNTSFKPYINRFNNLKTKYYLTHCAVSPNGNYIAGSTTNDQVVIWASDSYSRTVRVMGYSKMAVATFKCADTINCINFNRDSTKLLSCLDDGSVIIWDTSKAFGASMVALRKRFSVINQRTDLKVLVPDDNGTLRLFEGIEGKENRTLALRPKAIHNPSEGTATYDITCCALSYNCDILFGTLDGELILHSNTNNETNHLDRHESEVTFCAFIESLKKFVSASKDSTFRIYRRHSMTYERPKYESKSQIIEGTVIRDIDFGQIVDCKLFSKENKCMVWSQNGSLFLLDLHRNRLLATCQQNTEQINSADITSDETLIATVYSDKSVTLWRWGTGIGDIDPYSALNPIRTLKSECCPRSCRFSPNSDFLVIGHDSGVIQIWNFDATEGKQLLHRFQDMHTDWVNDISVSPNGDLIISVSKSIKLWNRSGQLLQTFKTNGGSMNSLYTNFVDIENTQNNQNNDRFNKIVTIDDAGVLYILQILNFQ